MDQRPLSRTDAIRLQVLERKILKRMFGSVKVYNQYRLRHNVQLYEIYWEPDVLQFLQLSKLRWTGPAHPGWTHQSIGYCPAYVSYHVNHPQFTSPSLIQVFLGLGGFMLSEIGNFSIHVALRDLRPPGSKERKIPYPTDNPFTKLFNLVSCPNYTYEFFSWFFFTVMTQCLPAGLFAAAGLYQMSVWAIGKHKNYRKEFPDYPKNRKAILPFVL
ncbi:unnamed protein product [Nezara viridula]|uniref:3-oxo-5-alpha-steroid 4-dehydrogenase C-terminal domain-containing protein n=1 Tax=Nezara viridula TaxID=85310 RepID=A0A9P0GXS1_NEZVI|nr:unnamed protein product [Nezara viridula]